MSAHATNESRTIRNSESGTIYGSGGFRVALVYPNPYPVAASSLGYQIIYRLFNAEPDIHCERAVLPSDVDAFRRSQKTLTTIESGYPVGGADCIAISLAYEPDMAAMFEILDLAGIPPLRADRSANHPPVVLGGPITMSNALPLAPFADLIVMGDGELAMSPLIDALLAYKDSGSHDKLLEDLAGKPGFFVPALHGDRVPDMLIAGAEELPAVGQIWSPDAELSNMLLIETSRGCPRYCSFCVMRQTAQPMREASLDSVIAAMDSEAPRIGFVGAAVSEYTHIRTVLKHAVDAGKGVGISSLRADRLDEEFVGLLRDGGYRTMTVASDAPSQAMRGKLKKGLRGKHLLNAAELAHWAKMRIFKMYVIFGLPGESMDDIDELADFSLELQSIMPRVALGLSPLVPKLHTPLGDAEFTDIKILDARVKHLRKRLQGRVEIRSVSPKWAWVEYRLSQGGVEAGLAAFRAWKAGNSFAHYKKAFSECPEDPRKALHAAFSNALWQPAGMR
jgi:radical SAM superfamily enzyme YgiQ (UPF0313 family)